ncbi:CpaF family protein [Actinomadura darangshiensis]|uniref:CpaF family protein n=1 Tax=Actinomadura darangshiensis TaxID=705336 RepID=A0A4R5A8P7_9ACTN|nr:ATPase, T2SS/T4P/T4SS family [Actinomadura darangshiensis]TDD67229.1 CpaF family protein [Actinomadura darangshiensis]
MTSPPSLIPEGAADGSEAALIEWVRTEVTRRLTDTIDDATAMQPHQRTERGRTLIAKVLDEYATHTLRQGRPPLDVAAEGRIAAAAFNNLFALGGFQPLLENPQIENINANGCDNVWVRLADGRRQPAPPVARSDDELIELIRTIAARAGVEERRFDRGAPRLSVQLPDGSRLFAVMAVTSRPSVAIRRHRYLTVTLDELVRAQTLDRELAQFLRAVVRARKNVLICGGTAIGKTTLLRALASQIPPTERLITIEDSHELALDQDRDAHPDVVALQAREPNVEGEGEVSLAELVRWALRMSPDRVIVGEVRGPEVVPMLNAMSQGNDGSMATLHASSSRGAFTKLAAYTAQATERLPTEATAMLVAGAVHFVVFLDTALDGTRAVSSVLEVTGADGPTVAANEVFRPGPDKRAVPGIAIRADTMQQLAATGYQPNWERPA